MERRVLTNCALWEFLRLCAIEHSFGSLLRVGSLWQSSSVELCVEAATLPLGEFLCFC
jgi:hypothetical protein